jgi:hypothetical protein
VLAALGRRPDGMQAVIVGRRLAPPAGSRPGPRLSPKSCSSAAGRTRSATVLDRVTLGRSVRPQHGSAADHQRRTAPGCRVRHAPLCRSRIDLDPQAVAGLRAAPDHLLSCWRSSTLEARKAIRTTSPLERAAANAAAAAVRSAPSSTTPRSTAARSNS